MKEGRKKGFAEHHPKSVIKSLLNAKQWEPLKIKDSH